MDAFKSTVKLNPSVIFPQSDRSTPGTFTDAPGPGTYILDSVVGRSTVSTIVSSPQYSLTGKNYPDGGNMQTEVAKDEPGPGQYKLEGKYYSGSNPRRTAFPKSKRPNIVSLSNQTPGSGEYAIKDSLGKQVLSTKPSSSTLTFGRSKRPPLLLTSSDVGPGEYKANIDSCEKQLDSRKRTAPRVKFGTSQRKGPGQSFNPKNPNMISPGPGDYQLGGSVSSSTRGTIYRSTPAPTLSGRTKFGSPFA